MNTGLNYNAADFINEVEKFAAHSLNRKAELIILYDSAIDSNQVDVFKNACFTAKYLIGMMRVLKEEGNNPQVNSLEHVKKDFSENILKIIEQLRQLISGEEDSKKKYFEDEFFAKTHPALTNLNELLLDLECTKLYLNQLKRHTKN